VLYEDSNFLWSSKSGLVKLMERFLINNNAVSTSIGFISLSFCKWPLVLGSKTLPKKLYTCAKSGITRSDGTWFIWSFASPGWHVLGGPSVLLEQKLFGPSVPGPKSFTIDEATAGGMELTAHEETVAFMLEFLWTEDESVLSP
jgi:hypothetical protein